MNMATNYTYNGNGITPLRQAVATDPGFIAGVAATSQVLYQRVTDIDLLPGPILPGPILPDSFGRSSTAYAPSTVPAIATPVTPPFP